MTIIFQKIDNISTPPTITTDSRVTHRHLCYVISEVNSLLNIHNNVEIKLKKLLTRLLLKIKSLRFQNLPLKVYYCFLFNSIININYYLFNLILISSVKLFINWFRTY